MRRQDHAGRGAGPVDLFNDEDVGDGVETGAAVALGDVRAHEPECAHLGQERGRDLALLVDLGGEREHLLAGEVACGSLGELLLVAQREVEPGLGGGHRHWRTPSTRPSGLCAKKYPSRIPPMLAPREHDVFAGLCGPDPVRFLRAYGAEQLDLTHLEYARRAASTAWSLLINACIPPTARSP